MQHGVLGQQWTAALLYHVVRFVGTTPRLLYNQICAVLVSATNREELTITTEMPFTGWRGPQQSQVEHRADGLAALVLDPGCRGDPGRIEFEGGGEQVQTCASCTETPATSVNGFGLPIRWM